MITLAWDAARSVWAGSAEVAAGHVVSVRISAPADARQLEPLRKWTRTVFDAAQLRDRDLRVQIARSKVALYNSNWRDDDEPELSEAAFADRIRLDSILVDEPGDATLLYGDGGLFLGHSLVASLDASLGLKGVSLYG